MNIMHLRYAVEIENTGSISKAAENLYMGQPNLSKAIKELETALGIRVFERTPRGVIPTEKGKKFLSYARTLIKQLDEIEEIYSGEKNDAFNYRISLPRASYISYAFTKFINKIDKEKSINIEYKETNTLEAIRNIDEGDMDTAIIRYPVEYEDYFAELLKSKNIATQHIYDFDYLVVCSGKSVLAAKDTLEVEDLGGLIEIVLKDMGSPCPTPKVEPRKDIYVYERGGQFDILCNVTNSYMWVSPLPAGLLKRCGLIQRRCNMPSRKFRDIIIHAGQCQDTELVGLFVKELQKVKKNI